MKDLTSILVVLDRSARDMPLLTKALVLARHLNARIELFSCDAEHEYAGGRAYSQRGVEVARQTAVADLSDYLRRLSHSVTAQKVAVSIDVHCESPRYAGIVHKVFQSCPDLVMKAGTSEPTAKRMALDLNDWQLVRTCPVPLLLSRGGPWSSTPRFVAAVDVSKEEKPGLVERIVRTARYLSSGCHGELDIVFGELADIDAASGAAHATRLTQVGGAQHLGADRLWTLKGDPAATLPAFAEKQRTNVLVLGALTHQMGVTQLVGTLTRRLIDTIACDFILVRPGRFEFPARGRDEEVWAAEAWRNSYSSDPLPSNFA